MHISVDEDTVELAPDMKREIFPGGLYFTKNTNLRYNGQAWGEFMSWINGHEKYTFGPYWFFEEYLITAPAIDINTDMVLHMPIQKK